MPKRLSRDNSPMLSKQIKSPSNPKVLNKFSHSELRKILMRTMDAAADAKWQSNETGLKIQGQNLGFPLPDLTYQIRELVGQMGLHAERERRKQESQFG